MTPWQNLNCCFVAYTSIILESQNQGISLGNLIKFLNSNSNSNFILYSNSDSTLPEKTLFLTQILRPPQKLTRQTVG